MKKKYKSFQYTNQMNWNVKKGASLKGFVRAPGKPVLEVSLPPDFHGNGNFWSPEDLLVVAVNSCVMNTFMYFVNQDGLAVNGYDSSAQGSVEMTAEGYKFTSVTVRPVVTVDDFDSVRDIEVVFKKVKKRCLISNSLFSEVVILPDVKV